MRQAQQTESRTDGLVSLLQVAAVVEGRFWSCGAEGGVGEADVWQRPTERPVTEERAV